MKIRMLSFIGFLGLAAYASPASAQGVSTPVVDLVYGGVLTGTASVKNTGGFLGGEAGMRAWKNLDISVEGGKFDDVVPQRQLDVTIPYSTFLQQTQGKEASGTVKMPATYFGVGARWVFEDRAIAGWVRPYVSFAVGGARVKREPTFLLAGADITSALRDYGVQLGLDLTEQERGAAYSFGVGVLVPWKYLYVDAGYRMTTLRLNDAIGINRFNVGIGARF